jgi:hypothetical protein
VAGNPVAVDPAALMSLDEVKTAQVGLLAHACAAAITGNFQSSALGSAYTYPATSTDQANLVQAASSSAGGSLWCMGGAGKWSFVLHTQAQASAALADFIAGRNGFQQRLAELIAQVTAAKTAPAAQAIVWA